MIGLSNKLVKIIINPDKGLYQIKGNPSLEIESPTIHKNSVSYSVKTKEGNYNIQTNENLIFGNAAGGEILFRLPNASDIQGMKIIVKKTDQTANAVVISGSSSSQTIDGETEKRITTPFVSFHFIASGSNWYIV